MSAIQFLREKAGVLVAGLIGLSLFLFVISDFFGGSTAQRRQARKYYEIGKIGDETVSYQEFEEKVQNLFEIYKLSGNTNLDEATSESIREQTWQNIVRERILESQYKKLGIDVSTEELDELVLGNNPHPIVLQLFTDQQTGTFNKSFLVNFLKQTEVDETAKKYWLFFEDEIVRDRMNTKYNTFVAKGLYVTSKQIEFEKKLESQTVDFSFISKSYAAVPDSLVKVTKSEIEDYYSRHKENYRRPALRNIEYVAFEVKPSEDDIRETEQWINRIKEEFAQASDPEQYINLTSDTRHLGYFVGIDDVPAQLVDFVKKENTKEVFGPWEENGVYKIARLIEVADRPDSVHARHILLSPNQSRTIEKARVQADSLIKLIKSGVSFDILAMTNSDDRGSTQLGGDLGWFTEGRMVLPFNNACFTAKKRDILKVETTYGVHIVEILDQSKKSRKYNIGIIDRKIIPGSLTNQKVYNDASQFAGASTTYENFQKAVTEKGLVKQVANDVTPNQKTLPGLENPRSLIIALYQTNADRIVLDANQQAVFETGNKYVVAYCTRVQEEGIAPLADVENEVRNNVIKDKKADLISAEFRKYKEPGKTIDDIARTMGFTVQEATGVSFSSYSIAGAGVEPALIAAASSSESGIVAGPVKGNNGVFLVSVNNIIRSTDDNSQLLKDRLMATYQMRGSYEAYEALRKGANIVDKRYKFY